MNILITGAKGFVGRNLVENLKCLRDGKNRTRPALHIENIYEYDIDNTPEQLEAYCKEADFVFNLAGANRPKNSEEYNATNFGFASFLLDVLKKSGNMCPVMLSSSVQASLAGRFGISEYGLTKRQGENLFFDYAVETGAKVYVYRFPNLIGKWVRPNYNSIVGTLCYSIANDLPYTLYDPNVELELLFIDDLIEEMYNALEGHPHRAEYPEAGEDGYDGLTPKPCVAGRFCYVNVTYKATLGRIVDLLHTFHDQPQTLIMPAIPNGSFEKKLYSTYVSYLPKERVVFDIVPNENNRRSITELIKTVDHGSLGISTIKPGSMKGPLWHNSKWGQIIVVAGYGMIRENRIGTEDVYEYEVSGDRLQAVHMLPGYVHSIINLSATESLVFIIWENEIFDPDNPDTFYEIV